MFLLPTLEKMTRTYCIIHYCSRLLWYDSPNSSTWIHIKLTHPPHKPMVDCHCLQQAQIRNFGLSHKRHPLLMWNNLPGPYVVNWSCQINPSVSGAITCDVHKKFSPQNEIVIYDLDQFLLTNIGRTPMVTKQLITQLLQLNKMDTKQSTISAASGSELHLHATTAPG